MPKVAITQSTYNGIDWLNNVSLPSLQRQTHEDFTLFVTHDGFEDEKLNKTFEAIEDFEDSRFFFGACDRFLPPTNEQNWPIGSREWGIAGYNALNHSHNLIKAYNEYAKIAGKEGYKYIFHLDQDDAFHPNHISNLVTYLESNPECNLAYAKTDFYLNDQYQGHLSDPFDAKRLLEGNYIAHSSIAIRAGAPETDHYCLDGNEPADYEYIKRVYLASGKDLIQSPEITFLYYQKCSVDFAVGNLRKRGILPNG